MVFPTACGHTRFYLPEPHSFPLGAAHTDVELAMASRASDPSLVEVFGDGLLVT